MMKHAIAEKVVYNENDCVRIMVEKNFLFNELMSMIMLIEN